MVPVIVIASFTSFLLTTQLSLIKTQRSRTVSLDDRAPLQLENSVSGIAETQLATRTC
jgi:hypothetical protein